MLMMDRYLEKVIEIAAETKDADKRQLSLLTYESMLSTKRFVLDNNAMTIVESVASDRKKLRAECFFWPDHNCWIEMMQDGRRVAVHFCNRDSITEGTMTVFWDTDANFAKCAKAIGWCDFANNKVWLRPATRDRLNLIPNDLQPVQADVGRFHDALGQIESTNRNDRTDRAADLTMAALALINSPRLLDIRDVRRDKLNAARQKRGKWPLLAHQEVRINLAKPEIVSLVQDTDGSRRPLHFVRAHLRLWKGELLLVRPHWRGDPELGMVRPRYAITYKET